jgi:hypothetical protein
MIASGDTMLNDPVTGTEYSTGRPIFVRQTSGPGLTGTACRAAPTAGAGTSPNPALLTASLFGIGAAAILGRQRRVVRTVPSRRH